MRAAIRVTAVVIIGVAALLLGYEISRQSNSSSPRPINPIELDGPALTPTTVSEPPPATIVSPPTIAGGALTGPTQTPPPSSPTTRDDDDDDDGGDDD